MFDLHEFTDGTGRGIIAKKDIKKGTVLVDVPHDLLLCASNVKKFKPLEKVFSEVRDFHEFDIWLAPGHHVWHCHFMSTSTSGARRSWRL